MITMKDIIRENNPLLRRKSEEVAIPLTKEDTETIDEMCEYIFNSIDEETSKQYELRPAVGLASIQIGIPKKIIVIYCFDEKGNEHFYPMINPRIISYSEELTYLEGGEGCLSVDREVSGLVHRPKRVTVETYLYINKKLEKKVLRLKNYLAVVFQHEFDHLKGILFTDHINTENPNYIPNNSTPVKFEE